MVCRFCNVEIFVKTIKYTKPIAAPVTKVDELRHRLLDLTGEVYVQIPNMFCPMCGEPKQQKGGAK